MLAKPVRRDEQIKLIMECRQSGLTDYEWCQKHGINAGTFYNWVKRLKQSEGLTFPRGDKAEDTSANKQEVVRLDALETPAPTSRTDDQYNNSVGSFDHIEPVSSHTLKLTLSFGSLEIPNGTDPSLLEVTLRILGGLYAR